MNIFKQFYELNKIKNIKMAKNYLKRNIDILRDKFIDKQNNNIGHAKSYNDVYDFVEYIKNELEELYD